MNRGNGSANAQKIRKEIAEITSKLIEVGLVDDANFPIVETGANGAVTVQYTSRPGFSTLLKDRTYEDIYEEQLLDRLYNFKMLDGALIQMSYELEGNGTLRRTRLAFMPAPNLASFDDDPEMYLIESPYAAYVDINALPVPLRFDYDARPGVSKNVLHPISHLTLGQFGSCRIAATGPLSPKIFTDFILRCFYKRSDAHPPEHELPGSGHQWQPSITAEEQQMIHISVPMQQQSSAPSHGLTSNSRRPSRERRRRSS